MKSLKFFKPSLATTLGIDSWRFVLLLVTAVSLIGYPEPASTETVNVAVGWYGGLIDFHPSSVTIHPGDQVKWTWLTSGHSTTSGRPGMPNGIWNSGVRSQGATFTHTFNSAGTFPYYCTNDLGVGEVIVMTATPTPTPTHAPFFSGEVSLGNGVYYLQFSNGTPFGYYAYLTDPRFIYHFDMGYEYWWNANDGHNGIYFYDLLSTHVFYTNPSFPFPYLYDLTLNTVLYYYPDPNNPSHYTTNPRYFYNFATGQITTM